MVTPFPGCGGWKKGIQADASPVLRFGEDFRKNGQKEKRTGQQGGGREGDGRSSQRGSVFLGQKARSRRPSSQHRARPRQEGRQFEPRLGDPAWKEKAARRARPGRRPRAAGSGPQPAASRAGGWAGRGCGRGALTPPSPGRRCGQRDRAAPAQTEVAFRLRGPGYPPEQQLRPEPRPRSDGFTGVQRAQKGCAPASEKGLVGRRRWGYMNRPGSPALPLEGRGTA
ncbi:collagen alpha-1(I) chain-like [Cavia porcellus]|uniref:collagen alpha-1(I) chain-like n=1 Tax=Cavia porcellus TaxID=10141 RepID=UPI002FE00979